VGGGWHFRALLFWLALMAGVYLLIDRTMNPTVAVTATGKDGEVVVPRARDGHYYLRGSIQGQPIVFMVDTGASSVAVSAAFARRAGLPRGYPLRFSTANGSTEGELVSGQTVEAGGLRVSNIDVGVGINVGQDDMGLLGQSYLRHVEVLQADDRLILRRKAP
jgi:aspartyl protease family protein